MLLEGNYLILKSDNWDDFGVKAAFHLTLVVNNVSKDIGEVKIIDKAKSSGGTEIKDGAVAISKSCCSLGQTIEYYKTIHRLGEALEEEVLRALRDCTYDDDVYDEFKDTPQFTSSAIRFSTSVQALKFAKDLYSKTFIPNKYASYSFNFNSLVPGFSEEYHLKFEFFEEETAKIPSNVNVLIGRNGTGKTLILSDLAKAISGYGYDSKDELLQARSFRFPSGRPGFGKVIVVSYSAFDSFKIPGKTKNEQNELDKQGHIFGYKYCGLRERIGTDKYRIKTAQEVESEFTQAVDAMQNTDKHKEWHLCLSHILSDPSFASTRSKDLVSQFSILSSGQKIVLSILAQILQHIEPASIIIIDEPETHLHPSLMSSLMHALRVTLQKNNSYAIIATHSPVILQETPSKFVQVLSGNRQFPQVKNLKLESFGEEISTLTEEVFGVSFEESNFYTVLKKLSDAGLSAKEINGLFGKRLGLTARSFIASTYN